MRNMLIKSLAVAVGMAAFASLATGVQAAIFAPVLSPGGHIAFLDGDANNNNNSEIVAIVKAYIRNACGCDDVEGVYKQNVGSGEEGTFAGDYTTVFSQFAGAPNKEPSGATITWENETFIDSGCIYVVVKGGSHNPAWYLFDISTWNGKDTLEFSGFWPGSEGGAISHIEIFACEDGPTTRTAPEPMSIAIWSLGLGIVGIVGRRRLKRG